MNYKSFFKQESVKLAIFIGLIALVIRLVPEYLVGHYPIGYDTLTAYTSVMVSLTKHTSNYLTISALTSQNLLYSFFQLALSIHHFDILILLKLFGIKLYALLALSTYFMLLKGLRIEAKKAFYITLFYIISLAALRVSWDLFRNELGLIFLNLFLVGLFNLARKFDWRYLALTIISTLLVFSSHQIVSVLLLLILVCFIFAFFTSKFTGLLRLIPVIVFMLLIGLSPLYLSLQVHGLSLFTQEANVTLISQARHLYTLMFGTAFIFIAIGLINLFKTKKLSFFVFIYWFLGLSFIVIEPYLFFPKMFFLWDRWLLMLALPVAVLAYYGIEYIVQLKKFKPLASGVIILLFIVAINYKSIPYALSTEGIKANIPANAAFPQALVWNSIGEVKNNDVGLLMDYLKDYNRPYVLVADNRFSGLFSLEKGNFLKDNSVIYTYGPSSVTSSSLRQANQSGKDILIFDENEVLHIPNIKFDTIFQTKTPNQINRYIYKLNLTNYAPNE